MLNLEQYRPESGNKLFNYINNLSFDNKVVELLNDNTPTEREETIEVKPKDTSIDETAISKYIINNPILADVIRNIENGYISYDDAVKGLENEKVALEVASLSASQPYVISSLENKAKSIEQTLSILPIYFEKDSTYYYN